MKAGMLAESTRFGIASLLLRLAVGIAFILHGAPKIVNAANWMDPMPFHPPAIFQETAAVAEFFGGWALLLGVATRPVAVLLCALAVDGCLNPRLSGAGSKKCRKI